MVKEIKEPRYLCEYPGCWKKYNSWDKAQNCQNQGLIGPNLKSGLVLGKTGYRMVHTENNDKKTIQGLPEMEIYILKGELEPEGHERQYNFCQISFGRPSWIYNEEGKNYIPGKKHIWKFKDKPFLISDLESKLTYRWVQNNSLIKELSNEEFDKIKNFLENNSEAEKAREFLMENNLEGQLTNDNDYVKTFLKNKWDEYHS